MDLDGHGSTPDHLRPRLQSTLPPSSGGLKYECSDILAPTSLMESGTETSEEDTWFLADKTRSEFRGDSPCYKLGPVEAEVKDIVGITVSDEENRLSYAISTDGKHLQKI